MFKTLETIASHDPDEIPISSATSLMVILLLLNTITSSLVKFSSVMELLGRPELASYSRTLESYIPFINSWL